MDVRLPEESAAPHQLTLRALDESRVEIVDAEGGVRLNEVQVSSRAEAGVSDEIAFGSYRLVVLSESSRADRPRPLLPHWVMEARVAEAISRGEPFSVVLLNSPAVRREGRDALFPTLPVEWQRPGTCAEIGHEDIEFLLPNVSAEACQRALAKVSSSLGRTGRRFALGHASFPEEGATAERIWERALERLLGEALGPEMDEPLYVDSAMVRLIGAIERFAQLDAPVVFCGEGGVGKRTLARMLHQKSPNASRPFVVASAVSLEESLGQVGQGSLYLDAPNTWPQEAQAGLLKLWSRAEAGEQGLPRLLFGLEAWTNMPFNPPAIQLSIPALRDRPSEILPLAEAFLARFRRGMGKSQLGLESAARRALQRHDWPDNLRELKNAMAFAAFAVTSAEVGTQALPWAIRDEPLEEGPNLRTALAAAEREALLRALARTRWNVTLAAKHLGLPRRTVVYRMARLGLRRPTQ
jgi:hypothetical protein